MRLVGDRPIGVWGRLAQGCAFAAVAVGVGAAAGACTVQEATDDAQICVPRENIFCRCDNGEAGTKRCADDGMSFGACEPCEELPYPIGETTSSGGGGEPSEMPPKTVEVLMIPDSSEDAVGFYDPFDGSYLGDWLPPNQDTDPWAFQTPINAVQGLKGHIFVSDQLADSVFEFEPDGTFVGVFADGTDGLDNIRGIDFFGTDLFVSDANGHTIARFAATGDRLPDLIVDSTLKPFDILLEPNGNTHVVDIGSPDRVRFYPAGSTTTFSHLLQRDFPQQLKPNPSGGYLVASFSSDEVVEVMADGTVGRIVTLDSARGVHPLGNGHWLVTGGGTSGVRVVDPNDDSIVAQVREGSGFRFIEPASLPVDR